MSVWVLGLGYVRSVTAHGLASQDYTLVVRRQRGQVEAINNGPSSFVERGLNLLMRDNTPASIHCPRLEVVTPD